MSALFVAFAHSHGVSIDPSKLVSNGKLTRCSTTAHPTKKNGAYAWDGRGGFVWAWDGEGRAERFNDPDARPPTDHERERARRMRDNQVREREGLAAMAKRKAAAMLASATPKPHDYLARKGLDARTTGLVLPDGALFVPMRGAKTNELVGGQIIRWLPDEMAWEKKYLYGQASRHAVLCIGPARPQETCFVEGYATGLSAAAAASQMRLLCRVVVCFSDHNLTAVVPLFSGRRYAVADHDPIQTDPEKARVNPGSQGERAARAAGIGYAIASKAGQDINDVHKERGLAAACQLLMEARKAAPRPMDAPFG